MRTRRSPRNQDRLWRYLTPEAPAKEPLPPSPPRCWDCRHYPKGGRDRGTCALSGLKVAGRSQKECFTPRR